MASEVPTTATDVPTTPPAATSASSKPNPRVWTDVTIDGTKAGRIVYELFADALPRTAENFRALCTGEKGIGKSGKPLHYAGSPIHRIIPKFMCQAGDFTRGNGTGGESIYGEKFDDEGFPFKHDKPFLLSMANSGPNTNGSQFFITTVPTPHLDGKHVVFGNVIAGRSVVRLVEESERDANDKPKETILISDCGELAEGEELGAEAVAADDGTGDHFQDHPSDEEEDVHDPDVALKIAAALKEIGVKLYKDKDYVRAAAKYRKAIKYLDQHPILAPESDVSYAGKIAELKLSLLLNAGLALIQQPISTANARQAITFLTQALDLDGEGSHDDIKKPLTPTERAKAHYRRGVAHVSVKDNEEALKDFDAALKAVPNDVAITKERNRVAKLVTDDKAAQKARFAKMFGGS